MIEQAKKVATKDMNGNENGFLIELVKQGNHTVSYLSCCFPGAFKGYHLHKVREANYICVRGELTVIMYYPTGRKEVKLTAANPMRLNIPTYVPTGLRNDGTEEAWIINNPSPAYDPELKGEQVDYTQEQIDCINTMHEKYSPMALIQKQMGQTATICAGSPEESFSLDDGYSNFAIRSFGFHPFG